MWMTRSCSSYDMSAATMQYASGAAVVLPVLAVLPVSMVLAGLA